ncbi:uncharacterized protein LOC135152130 [Daucus carota subsp. sativus]|uniref:uncharacterized protein LOC135152130 n=1 Tax=Daucus carota subsp. sativus TaxID=79200 RepID=UPI0030828F65
MTYEMKVIGDVGGRYDILRKCHTVLFIQAFFEHSRLKSVLPNLVSPNQAAFVRGRKIGDHVLLAQSLCKDYHLNYGGPRIAFKLDISKAFDSLNWEFLFNVLHLQGFHPVFVNWLKICIMGSMVSVKVNGVLEGYFKCQSGLKQGDPLSPYLFVLAMEVLTATLNQATSTGDFKYHSRTKEVGISHLIFADDVMLFCHGDNTSVRILLEAVEAFSSMSGLYPNNSKCVTFFGNVPSAIQDFTIATSRFNRGTLPVTYLGLPLISGKLHARDCQPLITNITNRFEAWNSKFISQAGRAQLINSVIFGVQNHWSMYLFLPKVIIKRIQSALSRFLWKGGNSGPCQYKVAWSFCCNTKLEGGLGFKELLGWNRSAICFQAWRIIRNNEDSLWIKWVHAHFLKNRAFWTLSIPAKCPWGLRKILNSREMLQQHVQYRVGRDSRFLIWHDLWGGNRPLIDVLGLRAISSLESDLLAPLSSIIRNGEWSLGQSNDLTIINLRSICSSIAIHDCDDILWDGNVVKSLSIRDIWDGVRLRGSLPAWYSFVWCKFVVPRWAFNSWLVVQERLLTKDRMTHFRMPVNQLCVLCGMANETHAHLFCQCTYTRSIYNSWQLGITTVWSEFLLGRVYATDRISSVEKELSYLFVAATLYSVWRERNERIHTSGHQRGFGSLVKDIKRDVRAKLSSHHYFKLCARKDPGLVMHLF